MKNLFNYFFISFMLISIFSCDTENIDTSAVQAKEFYNSKEIVESPIDNLGVNQATSIILEGDFKVDKLEDNKIVIYTETKDTKHVFILEGVEADFEVNSTMKRVSYLKNAISFDDTMIVGVDGVSNSEVEILSKSTTKNEYQKTKVLIHKWYSKKDSNYDNISPTSAVEMMVVPGPPSLEDSSCNAGGEGATSCSVGGGATGCSVSCGSGYHACCNVTAMGLNDCHCEAN